MGEGTKIEWATHTFNPWIGCTKVSDGCKNCYAEQRSRRFPDQGQWGPGAPRGRTSERNWRKPIKWNREAALGEDHWDYSGPGDKPYPRPRVFCSSLADWLDAEIDPLWLADLLALIAATPYLNWLLLTKRPELWRERMELVTEATGYADGGEHPGGQFAYDWICHGARPNVWLGTSAEHQEAWDERKEEFLAIPARVRFVSCEPLLGSIDLGLLPDEQEIHWVIAGGESGPNARPMHPAWARSLRDQCAATGVAYHFKQWGAWAPGGEIGGQVTHLDVDGDFDCGGQRMVRVGKKKAGRLLDGMQHDGVPVVLP